MLLCEFNSIQLRNFNLPSLRVDEERVPGHFVLGVYAALVQQRQQHTREVDERRLEHLIRHREVLVAIVRRVKVRHGDTVCPVR